MSDKYQLPEGAGIRVLADGDWYTVDEFIEGDAVLRPLGENGGVVRGSDAPTVELHFVEPDDDIAEFYTTGRSHDDARTDGGDDVCPECGSPISSLVIRGPGDVTAQPCGHAARSLLQESMDTVRPDGGDDVG